MRTPTAGRTYAHKVDGYTYRVNLENALGGGLLLRVFVDGAKVLESVRSANESTDDAMAFGKRLAEEYISKQPAKVDAQTP